MIKMTVHGWNVPADVLDAAWLRASKKEWFDAASVRAILFDVMGGHLSTFGADAKGRRHFYDAIDALGTRLIGKWAKDGMIMKVIGTRKWKAKS